MNDDNTRTMVKAIRIIREMDQGELAEMSGVNASVLSQFERGWLRITDSKEAAIKAALGITEAVETAFESLLAVMYEQKRD